MTWLVKHDYTNQIRLQELENAIVSTQGPDPRTIKNWTRALETLGFIEEIRRLDRKRVVYQMHLEKCYEIEKLRVMHRGQKKLG